MQDSNDKGFALYDDVSGVVREDLANGSDLNDLFADWKRAGRTAGRTKGIWEERRRGRRSFRSRSHSRRSRQEQRFGSRLLARDGHGAAAHARGRDRTRQAHRTRAECGSQGAIALAAGDPDFCSTPSTTWSAGRISVLDVLQAPDPQAGRDEEEVLRSLKKQLVDAMQEIEKLYRKAQQTQQKLISTSRNMKPKQHRKLRFEYARLMVCDLAPDPGHSVRSAFSAFA